MGPQDHEEVVGWVAHGLTQLASDPARMKAEANHWLEGREYVALRLRGAA